MYNYKGVFYKEEKEKKYYEGGAHFSYSDLVYELNQLIKERNNNIDGYSSKDSKDNMLLSGNYKNFLKEGQKTKSIINKQNKMKLKFLTINNNNIQIKNRVSINKEHKLILNTEKNKEINDNNKEYNLKTLISKNLKISPLKTNPNNNKKAYSINKKNYNIKTLGNKMNNKEDIYKNISLYINPNKDNKNSNLPIIKDFHHNNFSNRNIFKSKQNNLLNIKFDSKIETSKYNLFLKNKILSPLKNLQSNRENKILSLDFSDSKYNKNTLDTVTYKKNKIYFNKGRLSEYFKDEIIKQKNKPNINVINFIKNKKM